MRSFLPLRVLLYPPGLSQNNILIAYETLHSMVTRSKDKDRYMALKLDMSNAYDKIEWGFFETIMHKIGFQLKWVQLNLECVSIVSYSVLVNCEP